MKHVVELAWMKGMAFETELDGHKLVVDASVEGGGNDLGPRPKRLMLVALASCTGFDVVSILGKMKIVPEAFNVTVEAVQAEEHPKKYNAMKVIYHFKGKDLPKAKLERAVELSQTRYCGVYATYKPAVEFETEIRIEE